MKIILTENKRDMLALNWLNNEFGNLTEVINDGKVYYIDENRFPLFFYYQNNKNGYIYINYRSIWGLFESIFGFKYGKMVKILKVWLDKTYNLKGLTPTSPVTAEWISSWEIPII